MARDIQARPLCARSRALNGFEGSKVRGSTVQGSRVLLIPVAIALGSNLGDRRSHLAFAAERLKPHLSDFRLSTSHETEPVGVGSQPRFLNAAATGLTRLTARRVLDLLLEIEKECGRERPHPGAARTLDLDLIFYGDAVITEAGLNVPHPRFREREFVLSPLSEVAASWHDPVTGKTVMELLEQLKNRNLRT